MRPVLPGTDGVGFRCERCGSLFGDLASLQRHLLSAHAGLASGTACEVCGRRFGSVEELAAHRHAR